MTVQRALGMLVLAVAACGGSTTRTTVTTATRMRLAPGGTGAVDASLDGSTGRSNSSVAGAGSTSPPTVDVPATPPLDRAMIVLGAQLTELYEALATAVTASQASCATATAAITTLTRERAPVIASYTAAVHAGRGAELAAAIAVTSPTRYADAALRFLAAPALSACSHDAPFTTALRSLQVGPVGAPVPVVTPTP